MIDIDLRVLLTLGMALLVGFLLMPLAELLGKHFGYVLKPRFFRRSSRKVSYLGGVALALAVAGSYPMFWGAPRAVAAVFVGATGCLLLGLTADRARSKRGLGRTSGLRGAARFLVQVLIASAVYVVGLQPTITGFPVVDAILTVGFLVAATNAMNLIDNMDGVAGSTAVVTSVGIIAVSLITGQLYIAGLGAALLGASSAFLKFNLKRAKLFLGDSGSLFLGFALAGSLLMIETKLPAPGGFVLAMTVMGVPFIDIVVRQLGRWLSGKSPLDIAGDVDHISHLLVGMGLRPLTAALIHGGAAIVGVAAAILAVHLEQTGVLILGLVVYAIAGLTLVTMAGHNAKARRWKRALVFAAVAVLGSILVATPAAVSATQELLKARSSLLAASNADAGDLEATLKKLEQAESHAIQAEQHLDSPTTAVALRIPFLGSNLASTRDLATSVKLFSNASQHAVIGLQTLSKSPPLSGGQFDLELIRKAEPDFREAEAGAGLAIASLPAERRLLLPEVSEARTDLLKALVETRRGLSKAATTAEILPALLGESGPRTWFIAIQNSAEMRGTGGLIGGFGILRVESGQASLIRMDPDRSLPVIKSPVAASEEVSLRYDRFAARSSWQNVNMTPDFPTAAQMISAMWEQGTGERIDGVMAIDATGLARLVELIGPVEVPEIGRVVDANNLVEVILKDAYFLMPNRSERQDVLVGVGRQAFARLFSNEFHDPKLLAKTIGSALSEKHLLVWTKDQSDALAKLGVDGALRPADGSDYLMVVGQNAAANKLDYYATQEVSYDVDLTAPGLLTGNLKVESTNGAPLSGLPPYVVGLGGAASPHHSYLSVYLPGTSDGRLVRINGEDATMESHRESGLSVLSQFVEIPSGATTSLELGVVGKHDGNGEYRLVARKQPKITPDRLSIRIRLPEGAAVSDATDGMAIGDGVATWNGELTTDKEFFVKYEIQEKGLISAFKRALAAFTP